MASRKEYEMLFRLNAQLGSSYNSTFSKAQSEFVRLGNEIQDLNKIQSNITSYQKQQSSIESTRAKLESMRRQHELLQKEISETTGTTTSLEREEEKLAQKIRDTETALERQENRLDATSEKLKEAGVNTDNLADESARLGKEIDDLRSKQEAAADEADNFGNTASAAFDAAGQALAAAGIAHLLREICEAMVDTTQESIEFESAVTGVFKTVDGTDAQLEEIVDEIKAMSTVIPATTEEISAVAEAAGQLGIATEDIMDFTRVMIDLGESTNLSADEAASALAKFANITGTAASGYSRLGSVIVDLGNKFATTEADIVAMSTRLASAGTLAGLSEAEIMALAAAMSSVGIEAEAGGTAMTQTLSAIEKSVSVGGESLDAFAQVAGMSAEEFAAAWENSPVQAIQAFISGIGSLEDRGESAVLVLDDLGLSGVRQSNMLKSLGLAADTLTSAVNIANTAWDENVALSVEAGKRYATTESRLAMLNNAYGNLKTAIGDAYTPTLREASDVGVDVLDGATEFIQKNPALVKAVTAFVGVVGTATTALTTYAAAMKVIQTLNMAAMFTNPMFAAAAGVAALTAEVVFVASIMDEATVSVDELTEAAREMEDAMAEADSTFEETMMSTEAAASMADTYISKLEELEAAGLDNDDVAKEYHNTLALLCQAVPELTEYIDLQNNTINGGTDALRKHTEAWKEDARQQAYQEYLNSLYENYNSVMAEIAENEIKLTKARIDQETSAEGMAVSYERLLKVLGMTDEEFKKTWGTMERYKAGGHAIFGEDREIFDEYFAFKTANENAQKEIDNLGKAIEIGNTALTEAEGAINSAQESLNELTGTTEEDAAATAALTVQQEKLTTAIESVQEQALALAEAYTLTYNSAYESISGQKELWDEASEVVKTSVSDINTNLEEQADYWSHYNTNLESLAARTKDIEGLREVIASFADGSEASVNAIAGMAIASDEDLKEMVENWQALKAEQELASGSIADLKTNFSAQMDELQTILADDIEALSLGEEAAQSARETLQGFIDGAKEMAPEVQAAFNQIAATVQIALAQKGFTGLNLNYNIPGYASGTDSAAPGWALVGENGPELAYFGGGEKVIPAMQTAAMLGGSGDIRIEISLAPSYRFEGGTPSADQIQEVLDRNDNRLREMVQDVIQETVYEVARRSYT